MISHNTSISSFGNKNTLIKEKDYEYLHYFDDQSDNESYHDKSKSKSKNKKEINDKNSIVSNNIYSSSDDDSKEDNFFECDKDSQYETNEKVIEKSLDGNYGKVYNNYNYIKNIFLILIQYDEVIYLSLNKTVYKGYDFNAGREIAWCEIKLTEEKSKEQINFIKEQIELRLKLKTHDNILGYINSWYEEYENIYIIIEELCGGGNINSNYKYIQKPKIKLIKKWIKEILTGLDYLQNNKIIHHDIKCENIFLDRISGHLKIGCIGSLEQLSQGKEYFDKYVGTPEFMAPEINEGKYGFKSDIYSLGLTLLELLTVQKPYKECEGALNIYINKVKGILPESFKLITDEGIKAFILLCLEKEKNRPTAKELLEKNKWLCDKNINKNNSIIEIKGALRQKNFYLNHRYKSGGNFEPNAKISFTRSIKYNNKIFRTFNLKSKKSWKTNHNDSLLYNNNIDKSSSFSFKNLIINKSTTTSNIHKSDEEKDLIKINNEKNIYNNNSDVNSNNASQEFGSNKHVNNLNILTNKPIIKEKSDFNLNYNKNLFNNNKIEQNKKFFSPDEKNRSNKIIVPNLNFGLIKNIKNNNYQKLNSFREPNRSKINVDNIFNNNSAIKAINIHYDENKYDESFYDMDENMNNNFMNYKIVYSIICNDNKTITCEYNYEKDSVDIIIKNLKEIMTLDVNDIILLKNEFSKKLSILMDKKKLEIFFQKYFFILNKLKILGKVCKRFDKVMNEKYLKKIENNDIIEKIKDFQSKKNIINNININTGANKTQYLIKNQFSANSKYLFFFKYFLNQ